MIRIFWRLLSFVVCFLLLVLLLLSSLHCLDQLLCFLLLLVLSLLLLASLLSLGSNNKQGWRAVPNDLCTTWSVAWSNGRTLKVTWSRGRPQSPQSGVEGAGAGADGGALQPQQ
jgi:hypothetical protein